MSGDGDRRSPSEERLLRRLRIVAGAVFLFMIVFLVVVDTMGRLLVDRSFHVGDVFLGTIVGALLVLLGVEGLVRLTRNGNGNGKHDG